MEKNSISEEEIDRMIREANKMIGKMPVPTPEQILWLKKHPNPTHDDPTETVEPKKKKKRKTKGRKP